jgi:hypothetical protein
MFVILKQDCLVPRKYEADPKLATWVETQRVLWNRDFREGGSVAGSEDIGNANFQLPEPAAVPPVAGMGKTPDDWVEALGKADSGGATAEDAAELAATMTEDAIHGEDGMHRSEEEAQNAAVVEAAVAAAAEAVDAPLGDETVKVSQLPPRRLTLERKERLDALGFVWSLRSKRIDDHWDEMFRQVSWVFTCFIFLSFNVDTSSYNFSFIVTVGPIQRRTWGLSGSVPLRGQLEAWEMG